MLELKAAEVDIAKLLGLCVERLAGFSAEAERLIAQLGENQQQQADRYHNPVHYSVLTKRSIERRAGVCRAARMDARRRSALEYKWQEAFVAPEQWFNQSVGI